MAVRDVNNFQFFREAIIQRFRNPNLKSYRGIPYEPQANPQTIFGRVYSTFRGLVSRGLNLHQYLNIGERSVLENLYRNLQSDINLKFLNDPKSISNDPRFQLPDQYYLEQSTEITAAQHAEAASAQTSTGAPVSKMPGVAMRPPSVPRMPAIKLGTTPEQPETTQKAGEPAGPTIKRGVNLSGFRPPVSFVNAAKNFGSAAGRFFQRNVGKFFTAGRIATVVSGGIGAIVGAGLTNNHPIGIFGGAGAGAAGSFWIKSGDATKFLSKVGNGAINVGVNISNQVSSGATRLSMSSGSKKLLWALLGAFVLFFGISLFGGLTGTTTPGQASPVPQGGGDISSCKFTRGNANPPAESYKSPTLLSYFQQASAISSVPAAVLAAIARVELPAITGKTDADLPDLSSTAGCPRSPTGALGIMQIQPPGTTGYVQAAVNQGASYLGKTAEQLTEADFCDVKSSVIIASGFIPKKLQLVYGLGDGTKWDSSWTNNKDVIYKVAESYYGCLPYGGESDCTGPYNYGDDLWTSIQNCQIQPAPSPGTDFASQLVDKIKKSLICNGIVSKFNAQPCVDSVQPIPNLTAQEIVSSAVSYLYLQCVGFVQAIVGGITGQRLGGVPSAYMYRYFPPSGYQFTARTDNSAIIKAGDLAIWDRDTDTRPDGHVAYVVQVYDSSRFDVAEANWSGRGVVGIRSVSRNEIGFAGWAQKL